jgi:hypothetical protein
MSSRAAAETSLPGRTAAEDADDRHRPRAGAARSVHRAGRGAAAGLVVHVPDLRRGATLTAIQLFRHRNQDPQIEDNLIVAWARRALPLSSGYDEGRIVTRRAGRRALTPLFLALVAIGTTDLLFAFDSIPAVFGVTDHAYIVFAANGFALLGLRPLTFSCPVCSAGWSTSQPGWRSFSPSSA